MHLQGSQTDVTLRQPLTSPGRRTNAGRGMLDCPAHHTVNNFQRATLGPRATQVSKSGLIRVNSNREEVMQW
jgi:hypothetical protein